MVTRAAPERRSPTWPCLGAQPRRRTGRCSQGDQFGRSTPDGGDVSAGDLAATGMAEVLEQLATDAATGCLHVAGPDGTEALVYLRTGEVYAMTVPGRRPQLGAR